MLHVCSSSFPLLNIDVCLCFYTSASFSSNITFSFIFLFCCEFLILSLSLYLSLSLSLSASFSLLQPLFLIALYLSMSLSGSCSFSLCQSVSVSLSLFHNSFCFVSWSLYVSHHLSHTFTSRDTLSLSTFLFVFPVTFSSVSLSLSVHLLLFLSVSRPFFRFSFLFLSFLFPFYISFLYFFQSFFLSFIHFSRSFDFLSFPLCLPVSICLSLSICLNVPFCECVSHSFSLSQCLRSSHHVLSLWRQLFHSQSLSWLLFVFSVYTQRFSSQLFFRFCVLHCLTQRVPETQHLFSSLSLGDRYSNRRVQESTLMEQHKVHLTQHVQWLHYLAFEDRYSTPRVQKPALVYVNRPHLIMEHVHIGWPTTTDVLGVPEYKFFGFQKFLRIPRSQVLYATNPREERRSQIFLQKEGPEAEKFGSRRIFLDFGRSGSSSASTTSSLRQARQQERFFNKKGHQVHRTIFSNIVNIADIVWYHWRQDVHQADHQQQTQQRGAVFSLTPLTTTSQQQIHQEKVVQQSSLRTNSTKAHRRRQIFRKSGATFTVNILRLYDQQWRQTTHHQHCRLTRRFRMTTSSTKKALRRTLTTTTSSSWTHQKEEENNNIELNNNKLQHFCLLTLVNTVRLNSPLWDNKRRVNNKKFNSEVHR